MRGGLALLTLLLACDAADPVDSDGGLAADAPPGADAGAPPDAAAAEDAADPSAAVFDRSRLRRVEIEMAEPDWDTLRRQTRTLTTTLARPECLDVPFASPYTYFPAAITVDGQRFAQVGVRKKGFLGSLSDLKPSLKIKLDEYTPGVDLAGLSSFSLNNGQQDPTLIKPCLGFDVFTRAGGPAPRCAYAEVLLNGRPLGPYVLVETMGKRFLRRHFADDEGQLYEGTISDFRDGWLGTFEQETNEASPYDRADLQALTAALTLPDDQLLPALAPLVDVDAFLRFWASEVLIDHWDGYAGNTNNFYVYHPRSAAFRFLPWGVDGIFGAQPAPPRSVRAHGLLARRLYLHPEVRPRYVQELSRQLSAAWDLPVMEADLQRAARLVAPLLGPEERARATAATSALTRFVRGREAELRAELDRGGAEWTEPLRDPPCFEEGRVEATLQTTYGTHPAANIFTTGTGALTATAANTSWIGINVGSSAGDGDGPDDQGQAVLLLAATAADGSIPVLYLVIDPPLLAPGTLFIEGERVRGALLRIPRPGAELELVAFLWTGWLEVRAGAPNLGAAIDVSVHGELLSPRPR